MSGVQMPKWKGFTLPSVEGVHILREPPKSIHTRKKERVDMADVEYMIRNDDSRINEGVQYIARGTNPHIDVVYTNSNGLGGSTTMSLPNVASSNPYKAIKDGAFRPPLYFLEDRQALSRLKHPDFAVSTNPGVRGGYTIPNFVDEVDKAEIKAAISVATNTDFLPVTSRASYRIEMPVEVFAQYAVKDELLKVMANTNLTINQQTPEMVNRDLLKLKNTLSLGNVHAPLSILLYNPTNETYTEIQGSIKDKQNIAVQSAMSNPISLEREDGTPIKLKDYEYKVVNTNAGGQALTIILRDNDDIKLDRNLPLHTIGSGYVSYTKDTHSEMAPMTADRVKPTAYTNNQYSSGQEDSNRLYNKNINLRRQGNFGSFSNAGSMGSKAERFDSQARVRPSDNRMMANQQYGNRFE